MTFRTPETTHMGLVSVPLSARGEHDLDFGVEDSPEVWERGLAADEVEGLWPVFFLLNDELSLAFCLEEEETIAAGRAADALEVVGRFERDGVGPATRSGLAKLREALEISLDLGFDVTVWLYIAFDGRRR